MSDLFTTLAREALGVPMAVAPRALSRFEAPSLPLNLAAESEAAAPGPAPPVAETHAAEQRSDAAPPRSENIRKVSHERVREADAGSEIVSRTEFVDERGGREHERPRAAPEPARNADERTDPAPEAARLAPASFVAAPVAAAQPARSFLAAVAHRDETRNDEASPVPDAPATPQRRLPPDAQPVAPRAVVPEILRPETAARAHAEPQRAQPALQPRAAHAQTPPAIHVTIGRVEVRAVAPPAAARPTPQPKPVKPAMPLADYLEQRNRSG